MQMVAPPCMKGDGELLEANCPWQKSLAGCVCATRAAGEALVLHGFLVWFVPCLPARASGMSGNVRGKPCAQSVSPALTSDDARCLHSLSQGLPLSHSCLLKHMCSLSCAPAVGTCSPLRGTCGSSRPLCSETPHAAKCVCPAVSGSSGHLLGLWLTGPTECAAGSTSWGPPSK